MVEGQFSGHTDFFRFWKSQGHSSQELSRLPSCELGQFTINITNSISTLPCLERPRDSKTPSSAQSRGPWEQGVFVGVGSRGCSPRCCEACWLPAKMRLCFTHCCSEHPNTTKGSSTQPGSCKDLEVFFPPQRNRARGGRLWPPRVSVTCSGATRSLCFVLTASRGRPVPRTLTHRRAGISPWGAGPGHTLEPSLP